MPLWCSVALSSLFYVIKLCISYVKYGDCYYQHVRDVVIIHYRFHARNRRWRPFVLPKHLVYLLHFLCRPNCFFFFYLFAFVLMIFWYCIALSWLWFVLPINILVVCRNTLVLSIHHTFVHINKENYNEIYCFYLRKVFFDLHW